MKKIVLLAIFIIFIGNDSVFSQEIQVVSEEFPPFNYNDEQGGPALGISTEVFQAAIKHSGLTYDKVEFLPWKRAYVTAEKKKDVLIYSISRSKAREDLFHWIGPIAPGENILFAKSSRNDVTPGDIDHIKNQKYEIGTVRGDVREQLLMKYGLEKQIQPNNNYESNLKKLQVDRIDIWAMPEAVAYFYLDKFGLERSYVKEICVLEELSTDGYYMAFGKSTDYDTVIKLRKGLERIKRDGTYLRILIKYGLVDGNVLSPQ